MKVKSLRKRDNRDDVMSNNFKFMVSKDPISDKDHD